MAHNRKNFLKQLGIGGLTALSGLNFSSFKSAHPGIKPNMLKKGDRIGMISPGSSLETDLKYGEVVREIEKMGFKVTVGEHSKSHHGYFAGTDNQRAADLNTMFADPNVDAILPFRGGWGSNRILDIIDYEKIKANPKPLIGYSDITSLLLAIYAKTGLITFHGPVGKSEWTAFTRSYFKKAVMQQEPFTLKNDETASITTIQGGEAAGTLSGGNLTVLTSMLGSGYLPDWNNTILFLEDVGEDIYRIDRMLTQLQLNGVLNQISGFVFGKCTNCDVAEGRHFTLQQIVEDHIKELKIPAFIGANIGHIDDMFTIPVGVNARMDADKGTISLLESPVKLNS